MSSINRNNVLSSDRSCVRQSSLFRQYESGNSVKGLLGTPNLCWNTQMKEGVFAGQRAHDENDSIVVRRREPGSNLPQQNVRLETHVPLKQEMSIPRAAPRSTRPW